MLTLPLVLFAGGLVLFGIVLGARWLETRTWHNSLQVFSLRLPSSLSVDQVAAWLGTINASTHANRFLLLPSPPLALEIVGTSRGIAHYLLVPEHMRGAVLANLRAALPGVRLEEAPDYLANRPRFRVAAEACMTHARRPLAVDRATTASAALLASLQPLYGDEIICVQWIIAGGGIAPVVHSAQKQNAHAGTNTPVWTDSDISEDAETVRAAREKHRYPLLRAVVRVGIRAESKKRAYSLFGNTWGTLRGINAPGVGIVRRWYLPVGLVADRMQQLSVPTLRFPLTLNAREASGLVGLAVADVRLPGLSVGSARQLPPPQGMRSTGTVIAHSNYPGTSRPLALTTMDRLQHSWVVGPTGSGKSTLLGNLMVQDMQAGSGLVLIDARGDLVTDVLARVPAHRRNDVIVIDPSETARPIGFNVLNIGHGEHARELAVDHILHVLQDLYRSSWGPRTADILRASLLTLTATKSRDGSAFTLAELPELLSNAAFRQFVVGQQGVTGALASFWYWYASLIRQS